MKKIFLIFYLAFQLNGFSQIQYVQLDCKDGNPCINEMKNATVHVIIKDFCDDGKPYKKVLLENWNYSALKFDYDPKYNDRPFPEMVAGEWYMFLHKTTTTLGANSNFLVTEIAVGKLIKKEKTLLDGVNYEYKTVVTIPLFYPVRDKFSRFMEWRQDQDVAKTFPNVGNEFYFKNTLQILEQFINNDISNYKDYGKKFPDCDSKEEIKRQTLYIPKYIFRKAPKKKVEEIQYSDSVAYMEHYDSPYTIVTDAEIKKMFESREKFYYILRSETGDIIYNFILESTTGKIKNFGYSSGLAMEDIPMGKVYIADLMPNRFCREYFKNKKN